VADDEGVTVRRRDRDGIHEAALRTTLATATPRVCDSSFEQKLALEAAEDDGGGGGLAGRAVHV